jgi:hypothetical protein
MKLIGGIWHDQCHSIPSMKTFYLIKSFLPFTFLPIAPGVVQVELVHQGIISYGTGILLTFLVQLALTLAVIIWITHQAHKRDQAQAFLKMSCVSKKVCHDGQWMTVEKYLADHHNIVVSHGMTPEESEAWLRDSEDWLRDAKEAEMYQSMGISTAAHREPMPALAD